MRFNCLLTLFFLLNSCWQVQPIKKYFRSSFQDVNRAQLWSAGRLPCVQDKTVVLPDHFVFYFSSPLTGQSIILPKNGLIVFPNGFYTGKQECNHSGPVKENRFRSKTDSWSNSNAWDAEIDYEYWLGSDHTFNPIPDVLRLPCPSDDVFIANHYSASLALESAINRIEINSLTINSKQISRWTLSSFSRSLFASLAFPVSTSQLDIIKANQIKNKNPYTVDSQCGQILLPQQKYVCVHSVTSCPSNFTCSHPVQPTGFCCPLCAELIKARFHSSSPEHEYRSIATLVSNLQAGKHEHVRYFVHNVTTVDYELIIVNEKSADAHHFANDVYNHLQKENLFKLNHIELISSHQSQVATDSRGSGSNIVWLFILGIFIGIVVAVWNNMFGLRLTFNRVWSSVQVRTRFVRKRRPSSFTFVRFNSDQDEHLEMHTGVISNPAYDSHE